MKTLESIESTSDNTDHRIRKLLDGPPSNNYMQRQIQLSIEKYIIQNPEHPLDHDTIEQIGMAWSNSDDSKSFSKIARHADFKTHPKFLGSVANITLEDIEKPIGELFPK